jgi:hypothetical protein
MSRNTSTYHSQLKILQIVEAKKKMYKEIPIGLELELIFIFTN